MLIKSNGKAEKEYSDEKKLVKYINSLSKIDRVLLFSFYMENTWSECDGEVFQMDDASDDFSIKDIKKYLKKIKG